MSVVLFASTSTKDKFNQPGGIDEWKYLLGLSLNIDLFKKHFHTSNFSKLSTLKLTLTLFLEWILRINYDEHSLLNVYPKIWPIMKKALYKIDFVEVCFVNMKFSPNFFFQMAKCPEWPEYRTHVCID